MLDIIQRQNIIKIQTINQLLNAYESETSIDADAFNDSLQIVDSPQHSSVLSNTEDVTIEQDKSRPASSAGSLITEIEEIEVDFWVKLDSVDLDTSNTCR
jgi:hypothetical protein